MTRTDMADCGKYCCRLLNERIPTCYLRLLILTIILFICQRKSPNNHSHPRVRSVDDESLQQHARDLLLDSVPLHVREEPQEHAREVEGVAGDREEEGRVCDCCEFC